MYEHNGRVVQLCAAPSGSGLAIVRCSSDEQQGGGSTVQIALAAWDITSVFAEKSLSAPALNDERSAGDVLSP